jgi:hypothetical protein
MIEKSLHKALFSLRKDFIVLYSHLGYLGALSVLRLYSVGWCDDWEAARDLEGSLPGGI